jgi:hypothetical protein
MDAAAHDTLEKRQQKSSAVRKLHDKHGEETDE